VHHVFCRVFDFDWLERTGSNVQEHLGAPNAAPREIVQQLWREVQSGRRRRNRSRLSRVHGLISFGVIGRVGASDVWRQRNMPMALDQDVESTVSNQAHDAGSAFGDLEDLDKKITRDRDNASRLELSSRRDQRLVAIAAEWLEQHDLRGRARGSFTKETRPDDSRAIQDENVADGNEVGEIAKSPMRDCTTCPIDDHQPAFIAPREGVLRDLLRRQVEVEVGSAHRGWLVIGMSGW
jgi:hypothetical protein